MHSSARLALVALAACASHVALAQTTDCAACVVLLAVLQQMSPNASTSPDPVTTCKDIFLCTGACSPFNTTPWPVASPVFPTDGGVLDERRRLGAAADAGAAAMEAESTAMVAAALADPAALMASFSAFRAALPAPRTLTAIFTLAARYVASAWFARTGARRSIGAGVAPPCSDGLDIACDISRVFDDHLPLVDQDGDSFADDPFAPAPGIPYDFLGRHLRGSDWRGRDCNGTLADVYPGRAASAYGPNVDHDCNGIAGVDPTSHTPYEELWCSGENAPIGVAILGDSAAAHFHIPPQVLNARSFNLSGVIELAANEADWPQCSWSTGWRDPALCPAIKPLPAAYDTGSIYQRLRARNRCAHRDYQNLGVNGARTDSMAPPKGIVNDLARSQAGDKPLLTFYALIGNDVCDGHPGNGSWTTVSEFKKNVLAALAVLDTTLPKGSHVAFLGLVDGRVLFDTTHTLTHPLGITYPEVYDFLSCNNCNPCWGWLNSDAGWRNATSQRAADLSTVYDDIIATTTYNNFDMYRLHVDWVELIAEYVTNGGLAADVIEPVDGFHPSQTGNYLLADVVWKDLLANKPAWLGPVNPFNAQIEATFGDQGGY